VKKIQTSDLSARRGADANIARQISQNAGYRVVSTAPRIEVEQTIFRFAICIEKACYELQRIAGDPVITAQGSPDVDTDAHVLIPPRRFAARGQAAPGGATAGRQLSRRQRPDRRIS
jgi:hypothetical protein